MKRPRRRDQRRRPKRAARGQLALPEDTRSTYDAPPGQRVVDVGDCNGDPGLCMVLACRHNVLLDVRGPAETIAVGAIGGKGVGVAIGAKDWPAGSDEEWHTIEAMADVVAERAEYVVGRYGSTCAFDLLGLSRLAVADVLGVTNERVRQIEEGTRRLRHHPTACRAAREAGILPPDEPGFVPLVTVRRRSR